MSPIVVDSLGTKMCTPAVSAYEQIEDYVNGLIIPFDNYEALAKL